MYRIFAITFATRMPCLVWALVFRESLGRMSPDARHYDEIGRSYAELFTQLSPFSWKAWWLWVDGGWEVLMGLMYACFGPHLIVPMLFNALLAGCAAVLVYRLSRLVFAVGQVPTWAAYLFALSPSVVYYTSLPLKESLAVTALLLVVYGTTELFGRFQVRHVLTVLFGLLLLTIVRIYLFYLAVGCIAVCLACISLASGWKAALQVTAAAAVCMLLATRIVSWAEPAPEQNRYLKYFSVNYLHNVRFGLNRGRSKLFEKDRSPCYGPSWTENAEKAARGAALFLLGVDLTNIRSPRRMAALPEMLVVLYLVPSFISGLRQAWRTHRQSLLPTLLFFVGLVAVYGLTVTNLGALFRWRVQVLPLYYAVAVYGAFFRPRNLLRRFLQGPARSDPVGTSGG